MRFGQFASNLRHGGRELLVLSLDLLLDLLDEAAHVRNCSKNRALAFRSAPVLQGGLCGIAQHLGVFGLGMLRFDPDLDRDGPALDPGEHMHRLVAIARGSRLSTTVQSGNSAVSRATSSSCWREFPTTRRQPATSCIWPSRVEELTSALQPNVGSGARQG